MKMVVLTPDQKAVIMNDFIEKGWSAYKIWKEHPRFGCSRGAIEKLVYKIKETGSTERRNGSGRPITATTPDISEECEELICSQEDRPGTHFSVREIARQVNVSKSSIHRIVKKKNLHAFKRISTPQMNNNCRKRRKERTSNLLQRFSEYSLPRLVFQDEKDFSLQVKTNRQNNRVYGYGLKKDISPQRLFNEGNRFSIKVMVSAVITWKGVSPPFFVADPEMKVNGVSYLNHLREDLIPFCESLYPRDDFIFIQDSAPSHRYKPVQQFLKDKLKSRFVKNTEWPPASPDCNPLDYFFWNKVQEKVYEGGHCEPFENIEELKTKIQEVWEECCTDLNTIRKAIKHLLPRLKAVELKDGGSIKTLFG